MVEDHLGVYLTSSICPYKETQVPEFGSCVIFTHADLSQDLEVLCMPYVREFAGAIMLCNNTIDAAGGSLPNIDMQTRG